MARLTWDDAGSRFFERGVDRGVLYVNNSSAPWSGLVNVTTAPSSGEIQSYYIDGFKYYDEPPNEDLGVTIEAFTYPDLFESCGGMEYDSSGVGYDQQKRTPFNFTYRTLIQEGTEGRSTGYKLHLIYNALAEPTDRSYSTLDDGADLSTLSWSVSTTPEKFEGKRPTSHLVVDSRKAYDLSLKGLEDILYGTSRSSPRFPSAVELSYLMSTNNTFEIKSKPNTGLSELDYLGENDDLKGNQFTGLLSEGSSTRLSPTTTPGLYRLS